METIWKYTLVDASVKKKPLLTSNKISIELPLDSTPLSVGVQNDKICVWVQVNKLEMQKVPRIFYILGTGNKAPSNAKFLGTVMLFDQTGVFHIFELL